MEMQIKWENRCAEICLKGELDHHAAKDIMARMQQQMDLLLPLQLILDFSAVSFMDSSGIAVVMRTARRMKACGGVMKLRHVPPQPKKVFDAAGVSRVVEME